MKHNYRIKSATSTFSFQNDTFTASGCVIFKTVRRFGWINSGAQYSDQGMVGQRTYPAVSVGGKTAAALA